MTKKNTFNRRRFLRGAGGVVVGLPFLHAFGGTAAAQVAARPKRIICIGYAMGFPNEHWKPSGPDGNLSLPYITAPLEPVKNKCLFISGSNRRLIGMHPTAKNGHPVKKESAFTGTLAVRMFPAGNNTNHLSQVIFNGLTPSDIDGSPANSESIETLVGRAIRTSSHARDSVNLSVGSDRNGGADSTRSGSFFWEGRGAEVTTQYNPVKAFDALFSGLDTGGTNPPPPDPELQKIRARNQSVLDAVRDNFESLNRRVGRDDQLQLEAHAQRIRDLEVAIQYGATCTAPNFAPGELPSLNQNAGESDANYMKRLFGQSTPTNNRSAPMVVTAPLQVKILAHAMACDIAPVGRLAFTATHTPFFGIPLVDNEIRYYDALRAWHGVCHTGNNLNSRTGMPSRPGGGGPGYYAPELLDGMRFYWEQLANLLIELDSIPEGANGETALDNSLVVMTSDMGEAGGHGPDKTGFVLAGNFAGGGRGRHLRLDQLGYDDAHVLVSIANAFDVRDGGGAPINEFGLRGFSQGNVPQIFQP